MTVNGETVRADAHPLDIGGRIYVPFRATFEAVGIDTERKGAAMSVLLPNGEIDMTVGSPRATLNGKSIELDAVVVDIKGVAYVPLRFLNQAIGARATYDASAARVDIVSGYVGRNLGENQAGANGQTNVIGAVSAIDRNSTPPSITVVQAGASRTIAITSTAAIYIEDTTIHSQVRGTLDGVMVGDALRAVLARDGSLREVHAFYRSTTGTISAVSPTSFVLANGRVVTPDRDTSLTLNAAAATIGELKVGDTVTVRSNPETGQLRQVIASRQTAAGTLQGQVSITSFAANITRPLHAGETFDLVLQGTRGGKATYDLADLVGGIPMNEVAPGVYRATFRIPERFNVAELPLYGHLSVAGDSAPRAVAAQRLSSSTVPPQIPEVAPMPGQTINNHSPNIYATFFVPSDVAVDTRSINIAVNGADVTASATKTANYVSFTPGTELPSGEIRVSVKVADLAGNVASRSWTFHIR